jgi:hypothetical protein
MRIYSAYRSNQYPHNRLVKEFEAPSILALFQQFYDFVQPRAGRSSRDLVTQFFGAALYGCGWADASRQDKLARPQSLADLKAALATHWYSNEVQVDEHCVVLFTDDDEIDLCWYVFDDVYAATYPERTALYTRYTADLPADTAPAVEVFTWPDDLSEITPAGGLAGRVYAVFVGVYDGGVIEDLEGAAVIEGLRLPDLLHWLRQTDRPTCQDYTYDGQFALLSKIARTLPTADAQELLENFVQRPLTSLSQTRSLDDVLSLEFPAILQLPPRNTPAKSTISVTDHLWEVHINSGDFATEAYYDYLALFDDLWAATHPTLAANLLRFAAGGDL